jgi:hypothetical protein
VTKIEDYAFSGCTGLTEIHSRNPAPPVLGLASFIGVNTATCKLYVPTGSYNAYKVAWEFTNIIEENASANLTIDRERISIVPVANGLSVDAREATPVSIYNLSGQRVYQSVINGRMEISLGRGIYIVRVKDTSEKIVVK